MYIDVHRTLEEVQAAVREFPESVRERDKKGLLPLHRAVQFAADGKNRRQAKDVVRFLAEFWPEALLERCDGCLPLHLAARGSYDEGLVELLHGLCPKAVREPCLMRRRRWGRRRSVFGMMPLHLAVQRGHHDVIRFLIRQGPEALSVVGRPNGMLPLHMAIIKSNDFKRGVGSRRDRREAWGTTLRTMLDAWPQGLRERTSYGGWLPVHMAARWAPVEILKTILNRWPEALRERTSREGYLPIHVAARWGAPLEVLRYLVGLWPESVREAARRDGTLPFHWAVYGAPIGLPDAVPFLASLWPHAVMERSWDGRLPLHYAVGSSSSPEVVKFLVDRLPKLLVQTRVHYWGTALQIARSKDLQDVVDLITSKLEEIESFEVGVDAVYGQLGGHEKVVESTW